MAALNKVFLVEDELVIRKGIKNIIDWAAAGFEFCGEAPDGEVALPMIQACQPDLLITDIKMPFMDGLQLSRLVRENMPDIKIIILSGHDEFNYAREAIQLGITEYLLKPITPQNLAAVLQRVAAQIAEDRQARDNLQGLKNQVEDSLSTLREKFLLKVVLGNIPPAEIVEKARQLKLEIIARAYQVMVVKAELDVGGCDQISFSELEQIEALISQVTQNRTGILSFHKDVEEMVLIVKGDSSSQIEQHSYFLSRLLKEEVESKVECLLTIGLGSPKERLGDIAQSFSEAYANTRSLNGRISLSDLTNQLDHTELKQLGGTIIEQFLKTGARSDLDKFYETHIGPLSASLLNSPIFLHYFIVDLLITASKFVSKLGGNPGDILSQSQKPEAVMSHLKTPLQIKEQTCQTLGAALDFRDRHASKQDDGVIGRARNYIDEHFADEDISLSQVAAHDSLSAGHLSVLFGRQTGETFIEYLTRKRIDKAKELLRTTSGSAKEIAFAVGYSNPRYFYLVFKKVTGFSPTEFRLTAHPAAQD